MVYDTTGLSIPKMPVSTPTWDEHRALMRRVAQLESDIIIITSIASMLADLNVEALRRADVNRAAIDTLDAGVANVARKQEFTVQDMEAISGVLRQHGRLLAKYEKWMDEKEMLGTIDASADRVFRTLFGLPPR